MPLFNLEYYIKKNVFAIPLSYEMGSSSSFACLLIIIRIIAYRNDNLIRLFFKTLLSFSTTPWLFACFLIEVHILMVVSLNPLEMVIVSLLLRIVHRKIVFTIPPIFQMRNALKFWILAYYHMKIYMLFLQVNRNRLEWVFGFFEYVIE